MHPAYTGALIYITINFLCISLTLFVEKKLLTYNNDIINEELK